MKRKAKHHGFLKNQSQVRGRGGGGGGERRTLRLAQTVSLASPTVAERPPIEYSSRGRRNTVPTEAIAASLYCICQSWLKPSFSYPTHRHPCLGVGWGAVSVNVPPSTCVVGTHTNKTIDTRNLPCMWP